MGKLAAYESSRDLLYVAFPEVAELGEPPVKK